ncbi:hypothetical protein N0V88_005342 [Collariella sp. IMI 366227]|nr:hypothetical protein N0V88_005342 [Collariella sp. IMI 366227]
MTQPPSAHRLGLDARAAELKKKLLRSRSQSRANTAESPRPDPEPATAASVGIAPSQPAQLSATNFDTHKPPRPPPLKTSLQADANDIAALISSISSNVDEIPGPSIRNSNSSNVHQQRQQPVFADGHSSTSIDTTTKTTRPVPAASAEEGKKPSVQERPVPSLPARVVPAVAEDKQKEAHQPSKEVKRPSTVKNGNSKVEEALISVKSNGDNKLLQAPKQASSDECFTQLLNKVPDVNDWLEMTDYYNAELRARKLDRFRRVKALAAEKLRIEEEERKLMEEEELDMDLQRSTVTRLTNVVSNSPAIGESSGLLTPATPMPVPVPEAKVVVVANPPSKRAHDEEVTTDRKEKAPRLEGPSSRAKDADNRPRGSDRRDSHHDRTDRRPHSPSSRHDYCRTPPTRPRDFSPHRRVSTQSRRDYDDYEDRPRQYGRYKSDSMLSESPRRKDPGHHASPYPASVDLGRRGDTRFFIVKSYNEANGVWTTQVHNGEKLAAAFAECKNVILFFSVNQSKAFQGYARMTSAPSPSIPRPSWVKSIHWDVSDSFKVQWLSKTPVDFFRIGHIKNPFNEGLAVFVGRDGQELEEDCGIELLHEMEGFTRALAEDTGIAPTSK